jgi:hypothetical protein
MKEFATHIQIAGVTIPLKITLERRSGYRFAFVKDGLSLRVPLKTTQEDFVKYEKTLRSWVEELFLRKPDLRLTFIPKEYTTGDILQINTRQYTLDIQIEQRKTSTAQIKNGVIFLKLNQAYTPSQQIKAIKTLISRTIGEDFYPEIRQRVLDMNDRTFQQPINEVFLKYNHSNWGSCSNKGNVNLSTRLLLTPESIQDYVILHELAHLIEMNHSARFWALVERYMPDYKQRRKWLRQHQDQCDF